jgi:hypothetical protein
MAQVRVYNDNKFVFKQKFMDEDIVIEPGKFITMDESKAIRFRGTYSPIELDGNGQPMPTSYKMIRLEEISKDSAKVQEKFMCMSCSKDDFQTQQALDAHIDASHSAQWADKDVIEMKNKEAKGKHV